MKKMIKASNTKVVFDLGHALMDVVDKYNSTSTPVSGDWATETEDEMYTIAEAFNISAESAQALMIYELGFDPSDF